MPLGVFNRFFKQHKDDALGIKLAETLRLKRSMQSSGFAGSQISRNWRDLADAEERVRKQMADRHWQAVKLAEEGEHEAAIAQHRKNYDDLFHVADTYEVLAMHEQQQGHYDEAIAILEKGIWVFEELVDPEAPNRERVVAFMRRRLERLRGKAAAATRA